MERPRIKEGLAAITTEVLEDVSKEAEALILNAEKEAKETLKTAKEEADKTYTTIIDQANDRATAEKKRIESLTEVDLRNHLLQTKESLVDAAFERALIQLRDFVHTEAYYGYLLKFIEEAVKKIGAKSVIVHVNSSDKTWLEQGGLRSLSEKLHVGLKLVDDMENSIGGCKIQSVDGKVAYDNTIENRLQQLKPALRLEVAKILFSKEE